MKVNSKGIGLFGGTFDPFHHGHLIVAEWLTKILSLEKTFFIPTKIHPFYKRENITPENIRKEMVQRGIKDYPQFDISLIELERKGTSFTIDTIKHFKQIYPKTDLYYFIGGDNLDTFLEWKDPLEILKLCYLAVYQRSPEPPVSDLVKHPRVLLVDSPHIEISSSHIRKRIKKHIPFQSLVPGAVFEYINDKKLYQT